jgi:hypothetical protein
MAGEAYTTSAAWAREAPLAMQITPGPRRLASAPDRSLSPPRSAMNAIERELEPTILHFSGHGRAGHTM